MDNRLFYKPSIGVAADFIPFFDKGEFQLFHLHDKRDPSQFGEGTPWNLVSTSDFVAFEEHGEVLTRGGDQEQDLYVYTGSVIANPEGYHIFYTGHNPRLREVGLPEQAVMHATSLDLIHWVKHPSDTFYAPSTGYEPHDWRDPFVFWNEDAGEYWMLLAARLEDAPAVRKGCTAVCASRDLRSWEVREPLWAPELFFTHECPDLFRIGEFWYLVFSEFTDRCITRYRMARSLEGPWSQPLDDCFDGRAFYAAKTATDGIKRYVFGWNPTKVDENDSLGWQWGGALVVHEVFQRADGTLGTRVPESVLKAFRTPLPVSGSISPFSLSLDSADGALVLPLPAALPSVYRIDLDLCFSQDTVRCGIGLHLEDGQDGSFCYLLEPRRNRLVFDYWPNHPWDRYNTRGCERIIATAPNQLHHLTVLVDHTICVAYLDGLVAVSGRVYMDHGPRVALVAMGGKVDFSGIQAWTL